MKRLLFLMPALCLIFFSCKKDKSNVNCTTLDGTWKMVLVKDNSTNTTMTKPASLYGDVIVTFISSDISNGIFNGKTPTNDLGPDNYTLGFNRTMFIPSLKMTKVAETFWGLQFVSNIRDAQQYHFDSGELLNIITTSKTLTFRKL